MTKRERATKDFNTIIDTYLEFRNGFPDGVPKGRMDSMGRTADLLGYKLDVVDAVLSVYWLAEGEE